MVNRQEAITRLNREKDYEDQLVSELSSHFITQLPYISDLTEEQRKLIHDNLMIIIRDSMMHSEKFGELIQMVLDDGNNNEF